MRPVRFEPTTLGLGNRGQESLLSLYLKLFGDLSQTCGDQKVDQTLLNNNIHDLYQRLNTLPNLLKRLIIFIFSEIQKSNQTK